MGAALLFAIPFLDRRAANEQRSPALTAVYLAVLAVVGLLQLRAWASPSVDQPRSPLVADTYQPAADAVWLLCLWAAVGFLVYDLQQLRRHNRRIRLLGASSDDHRWPNGDAPEPSLHAGREIGS